jgi:hypothetical protein
MPERDFSMRLVLLRSMARRQRAGLQRLAAAHARMIVPIGNGREYCGAAHICITQSRAIVQSHNDFFDCVSIRI